jgi:hypothetical protein
MSRLRFSAVFIDCSEDSYRDGLEFWSEALEMEPSHSGRADDPYWVFPHHPGQVALDLQRIGAPSRYHIDLATDDVDREADRLEGLGAEKVERIESWWVMRAPTGHVFCVVPE